MQSINCVKENSIKSIHRASERRVDSMKRVKRALAVVTMIFLAMVPFVVQAQSEFNTYAPEMLFVADMSGSMLFTPNGSDCENEGGTSYACGNNVYGNANCDNPPYGAYNGTDTNRNTDCRKIAILRRAMKEVFDANPDGALDANDDEALGIRVGYMSFRSCSASSSEVAETPAINYTSGCNRLRNAIGTPVADIYATLVAETPNGGTPLSIQLREAKAYLDTHKAADYYGECRETFVVVLSDGADTFSCAPSNETCDWSWNRRACNFGNDNNYEQYKRRREVVARAKELNDAGYKVFVVGIGENLPSFMQNSLNWMAYYAGTVNPNVPNSPAANLEAYPIAEEKGVLYPTGLSSCLTTTTSPAVPTSPCNGSNSPCYAASLDPGNSPLEGYAFLAANGQELSARLKEIFGSISVSAYSFSQASIQATRLKDENYIYEASFKPIIDPDPDPFWIGHLKRYSILPSGAISETADWDAGYQLSGTGARTIKTLVGGNDLIVFNADISPTYFGVTEAQRNMIVSFFTLGDTITVEETTYSNWRLGDIYHSSPVTIGTPSTFYIDVQDDNQAFKAYRDANIRTTSNQKKIILGGANDGQLHAFRADTGGEVWSFIPPNFLPRLKELAHTSHPSGLLHNFYVDGPVTAYDVWLPSSASDGTAKSATDWKTLMVSSLGRGGGTTLWSSSEYCDQNFNGSYSRVDPATGDVTYYRNYCGYYAFDLTNPSSPVFKWRLGGNGDLDDVSAKHLGQPWSPMLMGRVMINGNEKWVGFVAGGYSGASGSSDLRGKGFYVIDLKDGTVLWRFTQTGGTGDKTDGAMTYDLAGPVAFIDYDAMDDKGFVDTAYVGDTGGNIWRFKFCLKSDDYSSCGISNWSGEKFFDAESVVKPIYTKISAALDTDGKWWIYFGTGDITDPNKASTYDRFYAIKAHDRTASFTTIKAEDLKDITSGTYDTLTDIAKKGWYINLEAGADPADTTACSACGEKIVADPAIAKGVVLFTTYTPKSVCATDGIARIYALHFLSGRGLYTESGDRSYAYGRGIPSAPIVSLNPGLTRLDIYASSSMGGGTGSGSLTKQLKSPFPADPKPRLRYWRDMRIQ